MGFQADLLPEKRSTELELDANDSPKESVERENRNEIEIIEETRNKENTVIAID